MTKIVFNTAFDRYETSEVIGQGGSGIVYGVVSSSGGQFALKLLKAQVVSSEKRKRFKNELSFCLQDTHVNILKVMDHGAFEEDGVVRPFYVMERFSCTIRDLINQRISSSEVLPLFLQMLNGVEAAHLKGVWHRDLKPENFLFNRSANRVVVADFGIAHFAEDLLLTEVETKPDSRLANFQYAAPEQRHRGQPVDLRADIYALGLMLNELFTGTVLQGAGYRTISDVAASFAYLDPLVERMVQHDPEARVSSIDVVKCEIGTRETQFLSRQTLSKLERKVVPLEQGDDSFIAEPVKLVGVDYQDGELILNLNQHPSEEWLHVFGSGSRASLKSFPPDRFSFRGATASVPFRNYSDETAQTIINYFKTWLEQTTEDLKKSRKEQARMRQLREIDELKLRQDEERKRSALLAKIKL